VLVNYAYPQSNHQITRLPNNLIGTAVLLSGGLDSAVLLAEEASREGGGPVQPIYVSAGLAWERAERRIISRLLAAPPFSGRVRALASLAVDMRDVYAATHWAMTGRPPAYHTPDEDVYLPGRNIILLGKAGVFCATAGLGRLVIGTLAHNPFPDATPEFRSAMGGALSLGLAHAVRIDAPYADMTKPDVIRRGLRLGVPFELTLSCMSPAGFRDPDDTPTHCGTCSKCRERHDAFVEAKLTDPTRYADQRFVDA
jgi:7-cyano-7-deazaguanine synthase